MPEHSFTCWALEGGGEGGGEYELFFFFEIVKTCKKRLKIAMFINQDLKRDFTPKMVWCKL